MSREKRMQSRSMDDLTKIYQFNKDIAESRERILAMIYNEHQRGETINKRRSICIENLRVRINKLALIRHDQLMKVYSHVKLIRNVPPPSPLPPLSRRLPGTSSAEKLLIVASTLESSSSSSSSSSSIRTPPVTPRPQSGLTQMKIAKIDVKDDFVDIQMVPASFQHNQESDKPDDDIIYPEDVIDFRPYKTVARYRKAIGESTNFREHPLLVGEDSTETLILGLESFAQQHGCELSFTNEDQQFDQSVYRAACGVADLGSIHLLATDSLLTANFQFEMDLDYDTEFAQSKDNVQKFAFDFCEAISNMLGCENTHVRVFSINKLADEPGKSQVNFGLTTPEPKRTEQLAHDLQDSGRSGFITDTVLKHVKPQEYECKWKPVVTHLQIRPSDFDPRYNFDYRKPGVPQEGKRGSYPYYLPIGWYRHGLNISTKYGDDRTWIGSTSAKGVWPVAFHGTKKGAVGGIIKQGFLISAVKNDAMIDEAIKQMGEEVNRPGLYVATHCNGGSDNYTTPFTVTTFPDKSEQFRIVFQCRVQPGKFTTHKSPVKVGEAWRIVNPAAVRPYGILLKKETQLKPKEKI